MADFTQPVFVDVTAIHALSERLWENTQTVMWAAARVAKLTTPELDRLKTVVSDVVFSTLEGAPVFIPPTPMDQP